MDADKHYGKLHNVYKLIKMTIFQLAFLQIREGRHAITFPMRTTVSSFLMTTSTLLSRKRRQHEFWVAGWNSSPILSRSSFRCCNSFIHSQSIHARGRPDISRRWIQVMCGSCEISWGLVIMTSLRLGSMCEPLVSFVAMDELRLGVSNFRVSICCKEDDRNINRLGIY